MALGQCAQSESEGLLRLREEGRNLVFAVQNALHEMAKGAVFLSTLEVVFRHEIDSLSTNDYPKACENKNKIRTIIRLHKCGFLHSAQVANKFSASADEEVLFRPRGVPRIKSSPKKIRT